MTPPARTWAKSRTRRRRRLAIRGVPLARLDAQNARAAGNDLGQLRRGIQLQAQEDTEAVPQGGGELSRPRGRPDEGKVGQIQADGVGRGAFADDDVDGKVLHGRV